MLKITTIVINISKLEKVNQAFNELLSIFILSEDALIVLPEIFGWNIKYFYKMFLVLPSIGIRRNKIEIDF